MKKIYLVLILALVSIFFISCGNDKHLNEKGAKEFMSSMLDEEVVFKKSYNSADKVIFVFENEQKKEIFIVSDLKQKNFDGINYGKYYQRTHSNYLSSLIKAYENEIKDILKTYNLEDCLDFDIFNEDLEGFYGDSILILFNIKMDENFDINENIERFANVCFEINNLLNLNYKKEYVDNENPWCTIGFDCKSEDDFIGFRFNLDLTRENKRTIADIIEKFNERLKNR